MWDNSTGTVIPVTGCPLGKKGCVPSPHVAAWFSGVTIRFVGSPVLEGWNRVIIPVEAGWSPHQAHPHLFPRWRFLPRECQDKLVFRRTGDLYQVSSHPLTVVSGLVRSHGRATCEVAKAFETFPSPRTLFSLKKSNIFNTIKTVSLQRYMTESHQVRQHISVRNSSRLFRNLATTSFRSFSFSHINKLLAASFAKRVLLL